MRKFEIGQKVKVYCAEQSYVGHIASESYSGNAVYFVAFTKGGGNWFHWRQLVKLIPIKGSPTLFGR